MQRKPSKSALKREQHALQALGEALIELPEEQLRDIPLDESLYDAIVAAATMNSRGALRRQRQLIGKLMRNVDAEPIRAALDAATRDSRVSNAVFQRAEHWRDRLVSGDHGVLEEFLAEYPSAETDLRPLFDTLKRCDRRDQRRSLGRQIFRVVHSTLSAKVHNTTG